jgi:hypothetical protein
VTTFLAIWGAVVATAVAVAELLGFLRDRPKLELNVSIQVRLNHPALILLRVANHGRQPATIVKAAFMAAWG